MKWGFHRYYTTKINYMSPLRIMSMHIATTCKFIQQATILLCVQKIPCKAGANCYKLA